MHRALWVGTQPARQKAALPAVMAILSTPKVGLVLRAKTSMVTRLRWPGSSQSLRVPQPVQESQPARGGLIQHCTSRLTCASRRDLLRRTAISAGVGPRLT